jgi:hypothetical protein
MAATLSRAVSDADGGVNRANLRTPRRVDRLKCRRAPRPEQRLTRHRIRADSQQGEFFQECLQSDWEFATDTSRPLVEGSRVISLRWDYRAIGGASVAAGAVAEPH